MVLTLGSTRGWKELPARGLSLLELIIGMSLVGLVTIGFGFIYATSQRHLIQDANRAASQSEASFALSHIRGTLFQATDVIIPAVAAGGNPPTVSFTLVFRSQPQPPPAGAVITSTYRLTGTDLEYERDTGGGFVVIARSILPSGLPGGGGLIFTRVNRNSVQIDVTARRTAGTDTQDTQLVTVVTPRGIL